MTDIAPHKWQFRARFRLNAFGWKSQPAIKRIKEAISEIKKIARKDAVLGADGAVLLLERISPALERVDSSSGSIGTAVNNAIVALVPIIAGAPADTALREQWLDRLSEAHEEDGIPYIEQLVEYWGELCASAEVASKWADRLIDMTRKALHPDNKTGALYGGTTACLSALYTAKRNAEILDLLKANDFWPYRRWAVKALAAQGQKAEAIRLAEDSRGPWASDFDIDCLCEEILLSSGLADEAYRRYGLRTSEASTYLAWFRATAKKYPHKEKAEVLDDLIASMPGEAGKWFAAAKSEKMFEKAAALAMRPPCSVSTLTRAARDFRKTNPEFAIEVGVAALHWLVLGYGYKITSLDVAQAFAFTMEAATHDDCVEEVLRRTRDIVAAETFGERFVTKVLGRELGLS